MTLALNILSSLVLASGLFAYVLPGERVLLELAKRRESLVALRVEVILSGIVRQWPTHATLDLHPELGVRVSDDLGGRWVMQAGKVLAGTRPTPPAWLPELEILVLRTEESLQGWFHRSHINAGLNQLARCGEVDCFVLGSRAGERQLWLDKNRFEVLRIFSAVGRRVDFEGYQNWDKLRFPRKIRVSDAQGEIVTIYIESVSSAPELTQKDFSSHWVNPQGPAYRD